MAAEAGGTARVAYDSSRRLALFLAAALLALAGLSVSLLARGPLRDVPVAYFFPAVGALYVVTGTIAWRRRPHNGLGGLLTAGGAAIIVAFFSNSGLPELVAIGTVIAPLFLGVLIHLIHACPTGSVVGRADRLTVAAGYFVVLVLQVPVWAFTPEQPPFDVVMIAPRADLAALGHDVQQAIGAVVIIATVVLVGRRLREYARAERRLLAVLLGAAGLAVVITASGKSVMVDLGLSVVAVAEVQLTAAALLPVGFLFVVLRGGYARPAELRAFTRVIAAPAGTVEARRDLDRAVAAALGDPTAQLLRWTQAGYTDAAGEPVSIDTPGPHRAVHTIAGHEAPHGAVVYDSLLGTDPAGLAGVSAVVGIALERERLTREVSESRAAMQAASQRVLRAGDDERRRVARDLHDGLQGPLVLLSMHSRQLARDMSGEDAVRAAALANGIDAAARTLRNLVDGVLPPPLVERGLAAAVRELTDSLPLDVSVTVRLPDGGLPAPVETTAYFIVAESLTNVLKHADAHSVDVVLRHAGDDVLEIEVIDDGAGSSSYTGGSGLGGLRDRLRILGGRLEITAPGVGTRVLARLPCG